MANRTIKTVKGRSFRVLRLILASEQPEEGESLPNHWKPLEIDSIVTEDELVALKCDIAFLILSASLEELTYVGAS